MFEVGDVVQLKSGGSRMTVESLDKGEGYDLVNCVWFEKDKLQRASFVPASLVKAGSAFAMA